MSEGRVLLTFEIALDGTIQNVQGEAEELLPDQQLMHRLLFAAKKTLIDEEVVSITVNCDQYTLKISASGAIFTGIITGKTL